MVPKTGFLRIDFAPLPRQREEAESLRTTLEIYPRFRKPVSGITVLEKARVMSCEDLEAARSQRLQKKADKAFMSSRGRKRKGVHVGFGG